MENQASLINLSTNERTSAWLHTSDLNIDYGKIRLSAISFSFRVDCIHWFKTSAVKIEICRL